MNNIYFIKGTSGSGKSTRVYVLLKFFEHIGVKTTDVFFINKNGKNRCVGFLVEGLHIFFLGEKYVKNGVERWQSFDNLNHHFTSLEIAEKWIHEMLVENIVIVDASAVGLSHRWRPNCLKPHCDEAHIMYYTYTNKEDYLRRIYERVGKHPSTDSGWRNNEHFVRDFNRSKIESLNFDNKAVASHYNFDEPISHVGEYILMNLGLVSVVEDFKKFCIDFDFVKIDKTLL